MRGQILANYIYTPDPWKGRLGRFVRVIYHITQNEKRQPLAVFFIFRAENETRTRDPNLGKVVLYQLSYFRKYFLYKGALLAL